MRNPAATGSELRVLVGRLIRRLRAEQVVPLPQVAALARLERSEPATMSELAAGECVRPQSMAQTLRELEEKGLVTRRPDELDKRRALIEMTDAGREVLARSRARLDDWVTLAIQDSLDEDEQELLERAIPVLQKLADYPSRRGRS